VGPVACLTKPAVADALHHAIALTIKNLTASTQPLLPTGAGPNLAPGMVAPDSVFVKEHGLLKTVRLDDIFSIAADNKTCSLILAEGSIQVRMSLRDLATTLPAERFLLIQRSYFINAEHIERLAPARLLV
jgi:DNA-binding LytR/AlgR family response regulator